MLSFSTFGNATIQISADGRPILSTDPWLLGSCYFGSWALHHPLSAEEIGSIQESEYIWISHGHPDHLHYESLELLPKGRKILLPDHYSDEICKSLSAAGFDPEIMEYKKWYDLGQGVRILCLDNINQDAILVIEAGDSLLIDMNDSPLCGERAFLKQLIQKHPNDKTFLFMLCGVAADMLNFVDDDEVRVIEPPEAYKPGCVWSCARLANDLGVKNYCHSSSQHLYARKDSVWANAYDISFTDIKKYWHRPGVRPIEPFVTYNLDDETYLCDWPSLEPDLARISDDTADDDWSENLTEGEWLSVASFIAGFETLRPIADFVEFKVGGELRTFWLQQGLHFSTGDKDRDKSKMKGVRFIVPKNSLLQAMEYGYFDDLLIGNFMKTQLFNMKLYPDFTPAIAKYGGNAKVFTKRQMRTFKWRYLKRNPLGMARFRLENFITNYLVPNLRDLSEKLGVKGPLKWFYRTVILKDFVSDAGADHKNN